MRLNIRFNVSKWLVAIVIVIIIICVGLVALYIIHSNKNPIPEVLRSQVDYKIIFPSNASTIDSNSYKFQISNQSVSFKVNNNNKTVVFTEQAAPNALNTGKQPYYPALGIHPYAQFSTKLGTVALTKFYQSGNYKPIGESAVLSSNGTLVIANTQNNLSNNEWKELFESLKTSR